MISFIDVYSMLLKNEDFFVFKFYDVKSIILDNDMNISNNFSIR